MHRHRQTHKHALRHTQGAEKRVRNELSEAVLTAERLNGDMNQLNLAHGLKLAGTLMPDY